MAVGNSIFAKQIRLIHTAERKDVPPSGSMVGEQKESQEHRPHVSGDIATCMSHVIAVRCLLSVVIFCSCF